MSLMRQGGPSAIEAISRMLRAQNFVRPPTAAGTVGQIDQLLAPKVFP